MKSLACKQSDAFEEILVYARSSRQSDLGYDSGHVAESHVYEFNINGMIHIKQRTLVGVATALSSSPFRKSIFPHNVPDLAAVPVAHFAVSKKESLRRKAPYSDVMSRLSVSTPIAFKVTQL